MRISDWSSDVCSSDLLSCAGGRDGPDHTAGRVQPVRHPGHDRGAADADRQGGAAVLLHHGRLYGGGDCLPRVGDMAADAGLAARLRTVMPDGRSFRPRFLPAGDARSDEHTPELPTLMCNSAAVL